MKISLFSRRFRFLISRSTLWNLMVSSQLSFLSVIRWPSWTLSLFCPLTETNTFPAYIRVNLWLLSNNVQHYRKLCACSCKCEFPFVFIQWRKVITQLQFRVSRVKFPCSLPFVWCFTNWIGVEAFIISLFFGCFFQLFIILLKFLLVIYYS